MYYSLQKSSVYFSIFVGNRGSRLIAASKVFSLDFTVVQPKSFHSNRAGSDMSANLSLSVDHVASGLYSAAAGLTPSGNIMVSPISVIYAAVLVYLGARGETRENLYSSLGFKDVFTTADADVGSAFGDAMKELKLSDAIANKSGVSEAELERGNRFGREEKFQLTLANGFFVSDQLQVKQNYLAEVTGKLKTQVKKEDYANNAEAARADINKWVEERTGGKIKDLLPVGALGADTEGVLANAVYFKASWKKLFSESRTSERKFHLLSGAEVPAKLMEIVHSYPYAENTELDIQYLEIPYANNDASMLIFLPRRKDGLRKLEKGLTPEVIRSLAKAVTDQDVNLRLPKFRVESSYDLKELMINIGVTSIFGNSADLSGIADKDLVVSKAFHKTFIGESALSTRH